MSFDNLSPLSSGTCIYGQLTGTCFSKRAVSLIRKCCERVLEHNNDNLRNCLNLNGSPKKSTRREYWSPIEVYISQSENYYNGNNKNLINFLKGDIKALVYKPYSVG